MDEKQAWIWRFIRGTFLKLLHKIIAVMNQKGDYYGE